MNGRSALPQIAIIGAGLAGLTVAREIRSQADVTVFEKSRGVGGRMATRYVDDFEFDHGAQFFTARSAAFRRSLEPLLDAGAVASWPARFVELHRSEQTASRQWSDDYPHFVGTPRMNSVGAWLAQGIRIRKETNVARMDRCDGGWQLHDDSGTDLGRFDWVVMTAPAAQTARLVPPSSPLFAIADATTMSACFALMLGFGAALDLEWDAARVRNADISWISVNSSKPERGDAYTLVVHSTNAWADDNVEADTAAVLDHLLSETSEVLCSDARRAQFIDLHRWRYANLGKQDGQLSHLDPASRLAACGDWFQRGRVEAACRSALHLVESLTQRLA